MEKKLNYYILEAKVCCNREAFSKIYSYIIYLFDEIYNAFVYVYKFLRENKHEIYQKYYIILWEAIQDYDFEYSLGFTYFLKKETIRKIKIHIKSEYRVKEDFIVSDETLDKIMSNSLGYMDRWYKRNNHLESLSDLTPSQLQSVYYDCYKNLTWPKACEIIGISMNSYRNRIDYSYDKIRNYVFNYRSKKNRERVCETVIVLDELE